MTEGNGEARELPKGWVWSKLASVAEITMGQSPPGTSYNQEGIGVPLINGPVEFGSSPFSKTIKSKFTTSPTKMCREGDLILCVRGSTTGRINIAGFESCIGRGVASIRASIDQKYVNFYIQSNREKIYKLGTGSTFPNVSSEILSEMLISVPPLAEQNRIIEKIEELFSDLDQGAESLKAAQKQLKVYRQAVLKWAFEGKLTEAWRTQHSSTLKTGEALLAQIKAERENRYQQQLAEWEEKVREWEAIGKVGKKPTKPQQIKNFLSFTESNVSDLPQLPNSWLYVEIELFLASDKKAMITGPFGSMLKKSDHKDVGVPVLGIENIGNGIFIPRNKIFVSEEKAKELDSFGVTGGDIVISRSGTVGEICCVPERIGLSLISTNLMRLSLDQRVVKSRFFVYLFQGGGTVKEQIKELCKGSTRDFLNQNILKSIKFPLPSFEEQEEIVQEIESRLSICDQLEATIIENLQKAEALRQSILKQAFEGKLVPQDPTDEPAEKLLERIWAEREVNQASKTSKQLKIKGL